MPKITEQTTIKPILLAAAIIVAAVMVLFLLAKDVRALENVYRYATSNNNVTGALSNIETDNPSVGAGWAYHRTWVTQTDSNGVTLFAEMGWIKGYKEADNPTVLAIWKDSYLNVGEWFGAEPTVGNSYNYKGERTTGQDWDFFYNSLSTPVTTEHTVWGVGDQASAGAETSTSSIDLGDVDYVNVQWRDDDDDWWCSCGATPKNTSPDDYSIADGATSDDWRVYDDPP